MPAKKTVKEETTTAKKTTKKVETESKETVKAEAETVKKAPAKKTTAKKAPAKKTAAKETETKTAAKKTAVKKETAKKAPAKKAAAKKSEKPVVNKKSVKDYEDIINWKKGEANGMDWLYIEVKADDLLTEVEAGVDNLETVCEAIQNCMLEGDAYIVEPKAKADAALTVRYYCDNLSPERKKYSEVQ